MRGLGNERWGVRFVPLENKSRYLKYIGPRAAEKLLDDTDDLVVGLPDLYPGYSDGQYSHDNLQELKDVQVRLVKQSLQQRVNLVDIENYMTRFCASALKHDLEMLLLATPLHLQSRLKMKNKPHSWQFPPEDQNHNKPPKRVVEELFLRELKQPYRETTDSHAILSKATLADVLFNEAGNEQCPEFRSMLDWVGEKTGIPAYKKSKR